MRKIRMIASAVLAAVTMTLAPMTVSAAWGLPAKTQTQTEDSYVFKSGAVEIKMGEEAGAVLAQLGAPVKPVFEIDSCAYQGKDKVYSYKDFEVSTYPKNGKECISAVVVTGASAATPEGIRIGSKAADVTKAYGASDGKYGIYRYEKGNTELTFYTTTAGIVEEIEYIVKQ